MVDAGAVAVMTASLDFMPNVMRGTSLRTVSSFTRSRILGASEHATGRPDLAAAMRGRRRRSGHPVVLVVHERVLAIRAPDNGREAHELPRLGEPSVEFYPSSARAPTKDVALL